MFDAKEYVSDIEECIVATSKPRAFDDLHQPAFYYALLKASILKLPDDWDSGAQCLILDQRNPGLSELVESLTVDLKHITNDLEKLLCYETLLRFAVLLSSNEHAMRSAGPV
jgi:hypothetical protein